MERENSLTKKERLSITLILLMNASFAMMDLISDARAGGHLSHVIMETLTATLSLIGSSLMWRKRYLLRRSPGKPAP